MYILAVDDDNFANNIVKFIISKEFYHEVEAVDNPRAALKMIQERTPDLLLIDETMPYEFGLDLVKRLQRDGYQIPFMMLTATDSIEMKLRAYELGAEDFVCKPYNYRELVARIKVVVRHIENRERPVETQRIRSGAFELLAGELKLKHAGRMIDLSPTEMQVLRELMVYTGDILSRDRLLSAIWNEDESVSNVIDVYISRLRKKIEVNAERPEHILSVRGVGYKFVA